MVTKSKPILIVGVDTDTVESDGSYPQAYAFYAKLSDKPDLVWERYLLEWEKALNLMQRDIKVVGDKLRLVFTYGDNVQDFLKYATNVVEWVNKMVEEHNRKVESVEKLQLTKQDIAQEREDEIRRKLKEL